MNMNEQADKLEVLRNIESNEIVLVAGVLVLAWLLSSVLRWALRHLAELAPQRLRLPILRLTPLLRLSIVIGAFVVIVPILIEPTVQNVVAIAASVGLALAFVFKDYASSLIAGVVTVIEGTYQPGDWVKIGDTYGEVKLIGLRAVHIVTIDDNEVIIPHSKLWSSSISNATSGSHSVLCVADFYLHPDHDGETVCQSLAGIGQTSPYLMPDTSIKVVASEKPWGTHYKLKAYVKESREQFGFISDLTIRGNNALRAMKLRFAQAPYAELGRD